MNLAIAAACGWLILANVVAMLPSRDKHWRAAYALIALGLPLLAWVGWENGPWVAALFLAGAVSILRWPVYYLWRFVTGRGRG